MKSKKIIVATRKSELALAQCRQFLARLVALHPSVQVEELHVVTTGDRVVDRPLSEIGGKGLFLKEIEEALLEGRADFAVHSMKDVPPELHPELCIAAVAEREDPRDVLVSRSRLGLLELAPGSVIGTSSLRRSLQLRALRPDCSVVPIRGNVGTRIQKCLDGIVDATVLARAGINRLGLHQHVTETLSVEQCLPAVGQGALALEVRRSDIGLAELLMTLEDPTTRLCIEAERGVLAAVEGDCKTPVAAYAVRDGSELWLRALLARAEPEGSTKDAAVAERRTVWPSSTEHAFGFGRELGFELLNRLRAPGEATPVEG